MTCWLWLTPLLVFCALLATSVAGLFTGWVWMPHARAVWRKPPVYFRALKGLLLPFWVIGTLAVWYAAVKAFTLAITHQAC
jgi:hypothetical protein